MKRRFLITCATGDIGSALCLRLAKKGHDLIITGRDLEKLRRLSGEITAVYPDCKVAFYPADLGNPETMKDLIAHSRMGIDGIVLMPPRPPELPEDPTEQFDVLNKAMRDCFTGPRFLLQQLLPSMEASDLKSVVLISGASSKQPISALKWEAFNDVRTAWTGCLKTFADTYGPKGIRFNAISPGQVVTPTYKEKLENEARDRGVLYTEVLRERASAAPLGRLASMEGLVKTIYFFLKSKGPSEVTAANLLVDGGFARPY
ncbi:SDR family oxidoreductase [Legionella nagasakiensis]|uniref:SDR family oxidoreductase n=1 Tax=Legionella nagasakiensis TaxID=535290 RepID=UPI0013EFB2C6|nr:SDR family oxidoreductase [Legionella nagasakiensis]